MKSGIVAVLSAVATQAAAADCVSDAAAYHSVNDKILRAILWNESSMKPSAINRNQNGSIDVGIAQINSIHFGSLREHGVHPEHLMNACVGTYVAAWHLRKQTLQHGNTWLAVGAYHSLTPHFNQTYANRVHATLRKWNAIPPGPKPFPNVAPPPDVAAPAARAGTPVPANASPLTAIVGG